MPYSVLQQELDARATQGLLRRRRSLATPQGVRIIVDGKPYLSFCSNDYLGLASHPQLIAALQQGAQQFGVGSGASHLVSGHFDAHQALEQALADFVGKPAALTFSTGYMANLGAVQALVGRGDTVFADKLNHASLNDAMLLSRAEVKRYRHNDMSHLAEMLASSSGHDTALPHPSGDVAALAALHIRPTPCGCNPLWADGPSLASLGTAPLVRPAPFGLVPVGEGTNEKKRESIPGRKLIITDAVFSMDGDIAPLPELLALCEQYDAWLLVDDAHGFGVLGEQGRGVLSHSKSPPAPLCQSGVTNDESGDELSSALPASPLWQRGARGDLNSPRIIYMATLGKAAGVSGAFVAAEEVVIDTLLQNARSYIYTTASPPALSVALLASLQILREEEWRRERLQQLITQLRDGLCGLPWTLMESSTPIQPLLVGGNEAALALSDSLRARGIWVPAIRPPTVPQGTARLRITLSAAHEKKDVDELIGALHELAAE